MVLTAIKKYPNQISTAFKRFPLASLFAVFSTIAFLIVCESFNIPSEQSARFILWLAIYPIAAMFIALDTSLVQEALKNRNPKIQAITGIAWFVISWLIVLYPNTLNDYEMSQTIGALVFIYTTIFLGLFVAPFFKQKNENAFWVHLTKTVKSLVVATIVAGLLLLAMELLFLGFFGLFGFTDPSERPFLYIFIFCTSTVLPLLFFSTLPTIDECLETTPTSSKFVTSICQFLFIPVLAVSIALFYCYILKFFIIQDIPYEVIIWLVVTFMVFMLALNIVMYPSRLNPNPTLEKKVLKIFPIAIFPLVLLMTLSIFQLMSDEIDELIIYLIATNIFFYIAIAILLIKKIECKSKYMAIAFCAILLIVCVGPLSAPNSINYVWQNKIKNELTKQGYTEFPLNEASTEKFIQTLRNNNDSDSRKILSYILSTSNSENASVSKYFSTDRSLEDIDRLVRDAMKKSASEDTTEIFDSFEADISNVNQNALKIPQGVKQAFFINLDFDNDDFQYRGDTLSFLITITDDQDTSKHSTYDFRITKQELEIDSLNTIETDSAIIGIRELHTEQWSKTGQSLRIDGLLFIK